MCVRKVCAEHGRAISFEGRGPRWFLHFGGARLNQWTLSKNWGRATPPPPSLPRVKGMRRRHSELASEESDSEPELLLPWASEEPDPELLPLLASEDVPSEVGCMGVTDGSAPTCPFARAPTAQPPTACHEHCMHRRLEPSPAPPPPPTAAPESTALLATACRFGLLRRTSGELSSSRSRLGGGGDAALPAGPASAPSPAGRAIASRVSISGVSTKGLKAESLPLRFRPGVRLGVD